jgi:hypothetical protein
MPTINNDTPVDPDDDFLQNFVDESEYARIRKVSVRTCQRDRHLRVSPPFVKLGRRVFYRLEAIQAWLLRHERSAPETRVTAFTSRATQRRAGGKS